MSEFVLGAISEKNLLNLERLASAFKFFDKDGGGSVDADEISCVLDQNESATAEAIRKLFYKIGLKEEDDELEFDVYCNMMRNPAY
eukprot:CAMPEP_0116879838 /NCGR_PEP_ID=MMETSP0463-20121206/11682_1 /TAXON_ID=181622 /ORGANISM="Strombidinopsis sp, Strain SopsisLIS2011" /LENGTH=85 /DNA_ID=CAMNT_0004529647 /DNA_START=1492 /DNA_END=1749 /DNA_ORIENTATION=-